MERSLHSMRLVLAASVVVVGLFFFWFADAARVTARVYAPENSAIPAHGYSDLYALQAAGWLKGTLALDAPVPEALAAAANPYDPASRPAVLYLHDASLYRGRYYMYFGPVPAVLAYLPYQWATGRWLGSAAAVALFCSAGFAAMLMVFVAALPEGRRVRVTVWIGVVLICAGASIYLPLLRRPAMYEVAISAGSCFALWAVFCVVRMGRRGRVVRPERWAGLAGLLLGLAVGCRPTYAVACLPLAAALGWDRGRAKSERVRNGGFAMVGFGVVIILLGVFNGIRFGSPLEFGQRYQLSSDLEGAIRHFSLAYVPYQIWSYLLAPAGLMARFPFVVLPARGAAAPGMGGFEYVFGLLTNVPATWLAVAALAVAVVRPEEVSRRAVLILSGFLAAGFAPVMGYFGACVRYMADFAPFLSVLAALGFDALVQWCDASRPMLFGKRRERVVAAVGDDTPEAGASELAAGTRYAPVKETPAMDAAIANAGGLGAASSSARLRHTEGGEGAASTVLFGGLVVAGLSFAFVLFATMDMYDPEPDEAPVAFERIGAWVNRPWVAWRDAHGAVPGAREVVVRWPGDGAEAAVLGNVSTRAASAGRRDQPVPSDAEGRPRLQELVSVLGENGVMRRLEVEYLGGDKARWVVAGGRNGEEARETVTESPPFVYTPGRTADLRISLGALWPVRPAEMRGDVAEAVLETLRTWDYVAVDGRLVWAVPGKAEWKGPRFVAVGRGLSARVVSAGDTVAPLEKASPVGGVRIKVELAAGMAARTFPVVAMGHVGDGDILTLQVGRDFRIRLGYDHWGKPTLWSGWVGVGEMGRLDGPGGKSGMGRHRLECWMPDLGSRGEVRPLVVRWDGRDAWRADVPFYERDPASFFVACDPLGGTTCEAVMPEAEVERVGLARP